MFKEMKKLYINEKKSHAHRLNIVFKGRTLLNWSSKYNFYQNLR